MDPSERKKNRKAKGGGRRPDETAEQFIGRRRAELRQALQDAVTDDDIIKITRAMLRSAAEGDAKAANPLRTVKAKRPDLYEQAEAAGPAFFFTCGAGVEIVAPGDTTREAALAACPSARVKGDKTYCGQLPGRRLCRVKDDDET